MPPKIGGAFVLFQYIHSPLVNSLNLYSINLSTLIFLGTGLNHFACQADIHASNIRRIFNIMNLIHSSSPPSDCPSFPPVCIPVHTHDVLPVHMLMFLYENRLLTSLHIQLLQMLFTKMIYYSHDNHLLDIIKDTHLRMGAKFSHLKLDPS
jgi:hypothetical protein